MPFDVKISLSHPSICQLESRVYVRITNGKLNRRGDSTISTSTHASLGSTSTHFTLTSVLLPVPFSLIYWQVTLLFRHFVPCCHSRVPRMSRVYGVEELSATLYLGRFMTLVIAVWLRVNRQFSWQTSTTKESSKPVQ
jgi:hypothetical protein